MCYSSPQERKIIASTKKEALGAREISEIDSWDLISRVVALGKMENFDSYLSTFILKCHSYYLIYKTNKHLFNLQVREFEREVKMFSLFLALDTTLAYL